MARKKKQADVMETGTGEDESGSEQAEQARHEAPGSAGGEHMHVPDGPFRRLMDGNFLQYASYVIRDRAIPDIEDGLKPVQRRILHALHVNDDGKFIKVANIVGHTMQYHPHGDASITDALVNLTNKRYLIEGQGNFGNILTGDPAAASRYIECRLTELARHEMFNADLTRFVPAYDGRKKEPVSLPAKLPLLLMLGAEGIAVGLSTRILPHNFRELIEAQVAILRKKPFSVVPDFQQGGLMDTTDYDDGRGRIKVRAVMEQRGDHTLLVREVPYGTTTESLMASIEDAARKRKIQIKTIHDYTAERVEIEIVFPPGTDLEKSRKALYAFTQCEVSVSSHVLFIKENRPDEMSVSDVLRYGTYRLRDLLEAELRLEQQRLLDELHRMTLTRIFIEYRIYKRIEECTTFEAVRQTVLDGVNEHRDQLRRDVTDEDVDMLLGVRIRRISLFDIRKNQRDAEKILEQMKRVEKNLASLTAYTIRYLNGLLKKYGDDYPRRTRVEQFDQIEVKQLTEKRLTIRYDQEKGYVGFDIEGPEYFTCSSHDRVVLVWNDGRYKVIPPPDKLFVDTDLIHGAVHERDRVMTVVYREHGVVYLKRFAFGGAVVNRDYRCIPDEADLLLFDPDSPPAIYVKYKPEKRQRIHQQIFQAGQVAVKGVKARGVQMTVKKIARLSTRKPRGWADAESSPQGAYMDFFPPG